MMSFRPKFSELVALTTFSLVVTAAVIAPSRMASAQTILHTFGGRASGPGPTASLIQATDGNFYGTTKSGGAYGSGTVFTMTSDGSAVTVLHAFAGGTEDGATPSAALFQATDGNFYGTTLGGGVFGAGTIFRMTPAGSVTLLHPFAGSPLDGAYPAAELVEAVDGNFYGTTSSGGASGYGTVFRMTPAGEVVVLHSFSNPGEPLAALTQGTDGNLYGTTHSGSMVFRMTPTGTITVMAGPFRQYSGVSPSALVRANDGNFYSTTRIDRLTYPGWIFRMSPSGEITFLYSFGIESTGDWPSALIQAPDGNFYGTSSIGGAFGSGTVFTMTTAGTVTVLHSFVAATDGAGSSALLQATDGNFYGTTGGGGALSGGTIFRITPAGGLTVLHTFAGTTDGAYPEAALLQATDGKFYGTTSSGGTSGSGAVFTMSAAGNVDVLHSFAEATDGSKPAAPLIQANDGNFYGTAPHGGANGRGTIFKLTSGGSFSVVHAFAGGTNDGASPWAALFQATDGNFYGTTGSGGAFDRGTAFMMTPGGTLTVLHSFGGGTTDGSFPVAAMIQASDGNFYGTTQAGGLANRGTVFRMNSTGNVTVLHHFAGGMADGAEPRAGLVEATDGDFYGTTQHGGAYGFGGSGTVFRITPAGDINLLHSFGASRGPVAGLIQASDGNFYGTTSFSAALEQGEFFKMTPAGAITVLHTFRYPTDGTHPEAGVIQATDGNFYGTTLYGGALRSGVVYRMPGPRPKAGDFDGDGNVDLTVYRPSAGVWYVLRYGTNSTYTAFQWGVSTDIPVAADYDGDGKTDVAVYRPATGRWYVLLSTTNFATFVSYEWGSGSDIPVPADYDGDGKADIAVYRPTEGNWYILTSSTNFSAYVGYQWGIETDIPVQADYDGDGKTDIAVYRPSTGAWYALLSQANFTSYLSRQWGVSTDKPVQSDYDGDGRADIAIYRPNTGMWYLLLSSADYTAFVNYKWGVNTDIPVPADHDGDGYTDLAVYRPAIARWYILLSSTNFATSVTHQWGAPGDVPVLKRP